MIDDDDDDVISFFLGLFSWLNAKVNQAFNFMLHD